MQYFRVYRNNVDASPQEMAMDPDGNSLHLVGFSCYNPNTSDVWLTLYGHSSGTVLTSGFALCEYGPVMVPANSQTVIEPRFNQQSTGETDNNYVLQSFPTYLVARVTTTPEGTISASKDCSLEVFYYTP